VALRSGKTAAPRALAVPRAPVAAAVLLAVWLLLDPRTPDLAAQVYRVSLFRHDGMAVWDLHWYAGHHLPGYSLLFAPLAVTVGMRTVAVLAVLTSALLGERLLVSVYGEAGRWGALWFALAAVADVWIGRLTFALGVSFAVASLLAFVRERTAVAAAMAVLCAAASPVAGALLALLVLTQASITRSGRLLLVVGAPASAVVLALALLFPEGGWEPYPLTSLLATVAVVLGFLCVVPGERRGLRVGAVMYLGVCVLCVALHTPMGANVERYGILLAGPLLLCGLGLGRRFTPAAIAVLCGIALWVLWGPVRETIAVAGDPSTTAAYYLPLERFLATHGGHLRRVEVPFTRSHWEAAWLAPSWALARGWEKQLDTRYDDVLLRPGLTPASYRAWLSGQAVGYVALPDVPLDPSSAQEGRLIRRGLPYLREVFRSAHWRVYEVLHATPIVQGPGRLSALDHDSFALHATAAGSILVRVHYTRYWSITQGAGCVTSAPGGWTLVVARHAGTLGVGARFSLDRALGLAGSSCAVAYPLGAKAKRPV
jgi:hypothetical protein